MQPVDDITGQLSLRHAFGSRSSMPRSQNISERVPLPSPVHFVEDTSQILYSVGRRVVLHNLDTNTMKFIPENDRLDCIVALAVSPNHKYAAVCERVHPEPGAQKSVPYSQVAVYDLNNANLKRKAVLTYAEISIKDWKGVCFSADNQFIAVQSGPPDWLIVIWSWRSPTSKVVATSSGRVDAKGFEVSRLSFAPFDNISTVLAASGPRTLQFYKHTEGTLKVFSANIGKREMANISDHAYINDEVMAVSTMGGEVWVLLAFDLKDVLTCEFGGGGATSISALANGFVVGGQGGYLSVYENHERKELFQCSHTFRSTAHPEAAIMGLATLPKFEDSVACCFDNDQVAVFPIGRMDYLDDENDHFIYVGSGMHCGAITGMDVALNKPLVVTCGVDHTIKVWNYTTMTCELTKTFPNDDLLSLACHPDGFQIAVGFRDKLRLLQLSIDDMKQMNEFSLKGCRQCRFSVGGHLLAAVNGPKIQIYETFSMKNSCPPPLLTLDGHSFLVTHISFQRGDHYLASCSIDGTVYQWDLRTRQRAAEHVEKKVKCECVVFAEQENLMIACGVSKATKPGGAGGKANSTAGGGKAQGTIRQLCTDAHGEKRGTLKDELKLKSGPGNMPMSLCLTRNGRLLFVGMDNGSLRCFSYPQQGPNAGEFDEIQAHEGQVSHMRVAGNDCYLITASEDGTIFVFDIQMIENGQKLPLRKPTADMFVDLSLISRTAVDEQHMMVGDLQEQIKELSTSTEYKVHMTEQYYTEMLKKQQADQDTLRESEQQRYETLKRMKEKQELEAAEAIQSMEEAHMKAAEELEALYERKLAMHAARYEEMRAARDDVQCQFEEKIEVMQREHEVTLGRQQFAADTQRAEMQSKMDELQSKYDQDMNRNKVSLTETEDVAEIEISKIMDEGKKQLAQQKAENLDLKTEAALLRKNHDKYTKELDKSELEIKNKDKVIEKKEKEIQKKDQEIETLKADVKEREEQISEREKRISDLKNKARELEKFKFVLDYRNEELKKLIEPKNMELSALKSQIEELDDELQSDSKNKLTLQQMLDDKTEKLDAQQKELCKQQRKTQDKERFITLFIRDLHKLVTEAEPVQWKDGLRKLHHTYVTSKKEILKQMEEWTGQSDEIVSEFTRQREYMERTLDTLRKKSDKTEVRTKEDLQRKVVENAMLIQEINNLRRDKKHLTLKLQELESRMAYQNQKEKASQRGGSGGGSRGESRGGDGAGPPKGGTAGAVQRPNATRGSDQTAASGVSNYRSAGRATPFDQRDMKKGPYKGSARQWEEMTSDRARMAEMAIRLDENNREIEMQKLEIRRLRDQVRILLRRGSQASQELPADGMDFGAAPGDDMPGGGVERGALASREFATTLPELPEGIPSSPSGLPSKPIATSPGSSRPGSRGHQ